MSSIGTADRRSFAAGVTGSDVRATRVLGIVGSLRRESFNRRLLGAAGTLLPPRTEVLEWDGLAFIPPFNEDNESAPAPPVIALRKAIAGADAVLVVTPEYNGSLPGQLKNALDWASRPYDSNVLRDKPVAVIGASPSPGGTVRAQGDARKILRAIGAAVIDPGLAVSHAFRQFDSVGELVSPQLSGELESILHQLVAATFQPARHRTAA